MVQWDILRLMLILQCIIGLQIQSINLKNAFAQEDIPIGGPLFIELTRYFKSDVGQCDLCVLVSGPG